jgi:hypothetical protein
MLVLGLGIDHSESEICQSAKVTTFSGWWFGLGPSEIC